MPIATFGVSWLKIKPVVLIFPEVYGESFFWFFSIQIFFIPTLFSVLNKV